MGAKMTREADELCGGCAYAAAVIEIYKRIPVTALNDFTDGQLNSIQGQANADFNTFQQILISTRLRTTQAIQEGN
ncbi:MAG: hypothetical protein R3E56_03420 [Burkholderiaceae bacterium]